MAPPPSLIKTTARAVTDLSDGIDYDYPSSIALDGSTFVANGHPFLTNVPPNVVATKAKQGCFVGFDAEEATSRHLAPIGELRDIRFMSIFRFKVWWSTHWVGSSGRDLEHETLMLLLDHDPLLNRPYVLLLPILEGPFRASLQPGEEDLVSLCLESSSTSVCASSFRTSLYLHAGRDPYRLVKDAVRVIRDHLGSFKLLEEKTPPEIVDAFGWCTWDAFYLEVDPEGVIAGVKALAEGGCPPRLVLIDDGWQSISADGAEPNEQWIERTIAGEQMPCRLVKFQENSKFKSYNSPTHGDQGLGALIRDLKEEFKTVDKVYVWQALCGYWGGLMPNTEGMPQSNILTPKLAPGLDTILMEDLAFERIMINGVGLVPPESAHEMFNGFHSYLQSIGVDGVKIDVMHLLELLCEDYGGRVEMAKAYYKAVSDSIRKHFKGNNVIASMQQCNDFMYLGTEAISVGRVGDDFWNNDPKGVTDGTFFLQGCHMAHCAYNSLWMGNFIHPDWDMFQSTHPCAAFHAASRAISGGPVYVSDSVGRHDFDLLRALALPDGSILRCRNYALPARDCLFNDPLHDGKTMLKIWNLNEYSGVLGLFNCQGGGWCRETRISRASPESRKPVTCLASPRDVEWTNGKHSIPIQGLVDLFAVFSLQGKKLNILNSSESLEITLQPLEYELFVVSPVTVFAKRAIRFAPIGLVNMLNSGGAVQSVVYVDDGSLVKVGVRGTGEMKVYASVEPVACKIDGEIVEFSYTDDDHIVTVHVPWPGSAGLSQIDYLF